MSGNLTTNGPGTAVSTQREVDPYEAYGQKVGLQGNFLSFKNNEYLFGQDGTSLPLGTHLVAFMPGLRVGWRKWWDNKVDADLTELLADVVPIAQRSTLGDDDQELWERDNTGKPRDPWQFTNILEMVDGAGERYIYSTASRGGINAVGRLCKEYGRLHRQKPGLLPIIELGSDFYMHQQYGKTYVPVFTIVGWADEETLEPEGEGGGHGDEPPFETDKQPAQAGAQAANTKTTKTAAAAADKKPKF